MNFSLPHHRQVCWNSWRIFSERSGMLFHLQKKWKHSFKNFQGQKLSPTSIWEMKIQENAVHRSNSPDLLNLKSRILWIKPNIWLLSCPKWSRKGIPGSRSFYIFDYSAEPLSTAAIKYTSSTLLKRPCWNKVKLNMLMNNFPSHKCPKS